jgi:hypothetical protein
MVAIEVEPVAQIRAVSKMTLVARVEVYSVATSVSRLVLQMREEQGAEACPLRIVQRARSST